MSEDDFIFGEEQKAPAQAVGSSSGIIERKMFTQTIFRIYPDGKMFVKEQKSWFQGDQIVQKKEKPKAIEAQKATKQEEEVY